MKKEYLVMFGLMVIIILLSWVNLRANRQLKNSVSDLEGELASVSGKMSTIWGNMEQEESRWWEKDYDSLSLVVTYSDGASFAKEIDFLF